MIGLVPMIWWWLLKNIFYGSWKLCNNHNNRKLPIITNFPFDQEIWKFFREEVEESRAASRKSDQSFHFSAFGSDFLGLLPIQTANIRSFLCFIAHYFIQFVFFVCGAIVKRHTRTHLSIFLWAQSDDTSIKSRIRLEIIWRVEAYIIIALSKRLCNHKFSLKWHTKEKFFHNFPLPRSKEIYVEIWWHFGWKFLLTIEMCVFCSAIIIIMEIVW